MKHILTLFVLFSFHALSQLNEVRVQWVNVPDSKVAVTYKKVEIGVALPNLYQQQVANFLAKAKVSPSLKINPFLEWELNVRGIFTHIASGKKVEVPGFYYQDYNADTITNQYKLIGSGFPMRIRFSPPIAGDWKCEVFVTIQQEKNLSSKEITFSVIDSGGKGYVKVHPNKRNLQLGDSVFYPVGVNFPSPTKDIFVYHTPKPGATVDTWKPNESHLVTKPKDWNVFLKDVAAYRKDGGNFIRILQNGWATLIEFEEKGNYANRLHYAWEQDRLVELCEERGIFIHFNMMQQEPFMKYGNYDFYDWDWWKFRSDLTYNEDDPYPVYAYSEGKDKEPHDMFIQQEDLRYHEQRIRYYLARYGYSTSIYLFELLSEPWHLDQAWPKQEVVFDDTPQGAIARKAITNYHTKMAEYIRQKLPFTQQLIGIDILPGLLYLGDQFLDSSIYSPYIDVIGFNPYGAYPEKMIISKSSTNNTVEENENSMYALVNRYHQRANKPILISEGGAGDAIDENCDFAQQEVDMMTFGFCGFAGFHSWIGWDTWHFSNWPAMIAAQNFFQRSVFLTIQNGDWVQGRQMEKIDRNDKKCGKELQYYLSGNRTMACGYVKNRTYNAYTKRIREFNAAYISTDETMNKLRDVTFENGKDLFVTGFKNRQLVEVIWYDFVTGTEVARQKIKSKRKIVLQHPELSVTEGKPERPVLWFTITPVEKTE